MLAAYYEAISRVSKQSHSWSKTALYPINAATVHREANEKNGPTNLTFQQQSTIPKE